MSTFKRFTDFCSGIALFVSSFLILREFLSFLPEDDPTLREKWRIFLEEHPWRDYRPYLGLIGLLALSLLVGIVLRKLPALCFATATLPFLQALSMLRDGYLYEHPMLYLLLGALPLAGNLFDALDRDRADGRHRAFVLANVSSLLVLGFFVLLLGRLDAISEASIYELGRFDQKILLASPDGDFSFWQYYAIAYALGIAISLLLRGAYWLDLLVAALPLGLALRRQIVGTLGPHNELILALMIACFICRLAVMVGGTPWKRKEKEKRTDWHCVLKNTTQQ